MSLKPVYQQLENLAATPKTKDKISLLEKYLETAAFKTVVKFALSPHMIYHIKDMDAGFFTEAENPSRTPLKDIFVFLQTLDNQNGASDGDKAQLMQLASLDLETFEVVRRIVNKDLRCGASAKTINKALPKFIRIIPYMRCSTEKHIDNIIYPAIAQEKADGMYADLTTFEDGITLFTTRNGKKVKQLEHLHKVLKGKAIPGKVNSGELVVMKDGIPLPRKIGNGILNSCLSGTADPEEVKNIIYRTWDIIDLEDWRNGVSDILYDRRWFDTKNFVDLSIKHPSIQLIYSQPVSSLEEARGFYIEIRSRDPKGEGAVLKNLKAPWKNHTSKNQIKMTNTSVAELRILDIEFGTKGKKYENCVGAIFSGTDDGLLQVSVGIGLTDDDRGYYPIKKDGVVVGEDEEKRAKKLQWWDAQVSSIMSVEFESVIEDEERKDVKSLFKPVYGEIREDRSETDTLEDLENR